MARAPSALAPCSLNKGGARPGGFASIGGYTVYGEMDLALELFVTYILLIPMAVISCFTVSNRTAKAIIIAVTALLVVLPPIAIALSLKG